MLALKQFFLHPRGWLQEWPHRRDRIANSWRDLKVITPEIIQQGEERARAWDRIGRVLLLSSAVALGVLAVCLAVFPIIPAHHHYRAYAVTSTATYAALCLVLRIISSRMDISAPAPE